MFALDYLTPPGWVERVEEDSLALLSDHAHCELKAATAAQTTIAKNPGHTALLRSLAEVAQEEMEHFARVIGVLEARGATLGPQLPSPYAEGLHTAARRLNLDPLLERLLVAAVIEARSLERFWLLAEHLRDTELAALYRGLIPSEAAHQGLFLRLARSAFPADEVGEAHARLLRAEGELVAASTFGFRVHSGLCGSDPAPGR